MISYAKVRLQPDLGMVLRVRIKLYPAARREGPVARAGVEFYSALRTRGPWSHLADISSPSFSWLATPMNLAFGLGRQWWQANFGSEIQVRIDRYGVPAKKEKPSSVRGGGTADRVARDILEMLARGHDLKPSLLMLPPEDFEALASEIRKRNG